MARRRRFYLSNSANRTPRPVFLNPPPPVTNVAVSEAEQVLKCLLEPLVWCFKPLSFRVAASDSMAAMDLLYRNQQIGVAVLTGKSVVITSQYISLWSADGKYNRECMLSDPNFHNNLEMTIRGLLRFLEDPQ